MAKTLQSNKVKLAWKAPAQAAGLDRQVSDIKEFAGFYQAEESSFKEAARQIRQDRLNRLCTLLAGEENLRALDDLVHGEAIPVNEQEQYLLNLYLLLNYMDEHSAAPLTAQMARQMHKIVLNRLPNSHEGGMLRGGGSLFFSAAPEDDGLPNGNELDTWVAECFNLAANPHVPAVVRAGLFYFLFMTIQPFNKENRIIAILGSRHILVNEDYNLYGLLNLEKHIFTNNSLWEPVKALMNEKDYRQRLRTDLSEYLEVFATGAGHAVQEVKREMEKYVKHYLGYDGLSPREKNNLNFWLEKAFYKHKHKLPNLTKRQQEIMMIISRQGSLSNKELVPVFQVDRKTIQRDFNTLMEQGLVEQRGAGRSLKYYLDLRINI